MTKKSLVMKFNKKKEMINLNMFQYSIIGIQWFPKLIFKLNN